MGTDDWNIAPQNTQSEDSPRQRRETMPASEDQSRSPTNEMNKSSFCEIPFPISATMLSDMETVVAHVDTADGQEPVHRKPGMRNNGSLPSDDGSYVGANDEVLPSSDGSFLERKQAVVMKTRSGDGSAVNQESTEITSIVGAHRIAGMVSRSAHEDSEDSDDFDSDHAAANTPSYTSLPFTVEAEVVPELVSATAIPQNKTEKDDQDKLASHACFCCGFKCGTVGRDGSHSRRPLYIAIGAIIGIVIIVVAVAIGVTSSSHSLFPTLSTTPARETEISPTLSPTPPKTETPKTEKLSGMQSLPTLPPTLRQTETLFTTLEYTHRFYGHMFDIIAMKDLEVVAFQVHMSSINPEVLEVWTKEGEYHNYETQAFQWAKIGEATVTGLGTSSLSPLPRNAFDPVRVHAGARQSFYITSPSRTIIYFQERFNDTGDVSLIDYGEPTEFNNSDLLINVGTGVQYPFLNHGPPNIFNGAIEYALLV